MTKLSTKEIIVGYYKNYDFPDFTRQTKNNSGIWEGIKFVNLEKEPQHKVDILVVLNHPKDNISIKVKKGGKIILIQEPPYKSNEYLNYLIRHFDLSVSHFEGTKSKKNLRLPAGLPWFIEKSYDEIIKNKKPCQKTKTVSWVTSSRSNHPGHLSRLEFISFLKEKKFEFDLFGRGYNPISNKMDALAPYKYSIAVENYFDNDYFTEKIIDVFLSDSIPIYYGCKNISKYFPEKSFIQIDIQNKEKSLEIIKSAIENNFYEKNKDYINEAKNLILNKYQFFPMIEKVINNELKLSNQYEQFNLHKLGLSRTEILKSKIKNIINSK